MFTRLCLFFGVLLIVWGGGGFEKAYAHKVFAYGHIIGDLIEGEIKFHDNKKAIHIPVTVFDVNGNILGGTKTNEKGIFSFKPTHAIDHVFKANLGGGHHVTLQISAKKLQGMNLLSVKNGLDVKKESLESGIADIYYDTFNKEKSNKESSPETIQKIMTDITQIKKQEEQAFQALMRVQQELRTLRQEVRSAQEERDYQSILGGIGVIFGLTGVYMFALSRREYRKRNSEKG